MAKTLFKAVPIYGSSVPKGKVYWSIDYSSQELYCAAYVSQCPVMLGSFRQPATKLDENGKEYINPWTDLHTISAVKCTHPHIFSSSPESKWVKIAKDPSKITGKGCARDKSKQLNFGILYSQGASSMSELFHVKEEEAARWIKMHKQTYEAFHAWAEERANLGCARGWIETQDKYSRIRYINESNSKGSDSPMTASINHGIQGKICLLYL